MYCPHNSFKIGGLERWGSHTASEAVEKGGLELGPRPHHATLVLAQAAERLLMSGVGCLAA